MARFFTAFGLVALVALAWAQKNSWSLFDNEAHDQATRSSLNSSRSYHK